MARALGKLEVGVALSDQGQSFLSDALSLPAVRRAPTGPVRERTRTAPLQAVREPVRLVG